MKPGHASLLGALTLLLAAHGAAWSGEGAPVVERAWSRATPALLKNGVVYMSITSAVPDTLVGVSSPVATSAKMYEYRKADGEAMNMQPLAAVPLQPGQQVEFKPGGYHVMLSDLHHPLAVGESFPLVLTFAKAGPQQVMVQVEKPGALSASSEHHHGAVGHGAGHAALSETGK
jgi:periplasmic copper chaperone A